jgi:hypothetical protein
MLGRVNYLPLSREEKLKEMNVISTIVANNWYDAKTLRKANKKQKPEYNKDTSRPQKLHDIPKDNINVWANLHILEKKSEHLTTIFKNFAVCVAYSTSNTIKNVVIFVHTMINTATVEFMN